MALPVGVFKGLGLWRASTTASMKAITKLDGLAIGEHCFVSGTSVGGNALYWCINASQTGSDWGLISASVPSWQQTLDVNNHAITAIYVDSSGSFLGPVTSTLGFSGSLHRLADGSPAFIAGTGIAITSSSNGPIVISSTGASGASGADLPFYHAFSTGSVTWAATTWTDITTVTNLQINEVNGITQNANKFTFASAGWYKIDARFNSIGVDNYLSFRLTSSLGTTLLQHTDYVNSYGQHGSNLTGIFQITGANDWVALEYVTSGGIVDTWPGSSTIDGEALHSVNVTFNAIKVS